MPYSLVDNVVINILAMHLSQGHTCHMYLEYPKCTIFFYPIHRISAGHKEFKGNENLYSFYYFNVAIFLLLLLACETLENCVWHRTFQSLYSVHKTSHVKAWTVIWDTGNYLAIKTYQDIPLGSFVFKSRGT